MKKQTSNTAKPLKSAGTFNRGGLYRPSKKLQHANDNTSYCGTGKSYRYGILKLSVVRNAQDCTYFTGMSHGGVTSRFVHAELPICRRFEDAQMKLDGFAERWGLPIWEE